MKFRSPSEKLFIEEVSRAAKKMHIVSKGLPIGALIKSMRSQLGMSQRVLAARAGVPQSTISRVEQGQGDTGLSTIKKILDSLSCDLVIALLPRESIDEIRKRQARQLAEKQMRYLRGTMNLENQQPDPQFTHELIKQEEERLLRGPSSALWLD